MRKICQKAIDESPALIVSIKKAKIFSLLLISCSFSKLMSSHDSKKR
jgi:hypothetical protein